MRAMLKHKAIGDLTRNGETIHYAYVNGIYIEGSIGLLTALLTAR